MFIFQYLTVFLSSLQVWDIRTGMCTQTFTGHESDINAVSVSTYYHDGSPKIVARQKYSMIEFEFNVLAKLLESFSCSSLKGEHAWFVLDFADFGFFSWFYINTFFFLSVFPKQQCFWYWIRWCHLSVIWYPFRSSKFLIFCLQTKIVSILWICCLKNISIQNCVLTYCS